MERKIALLWDIDGTLLTTHGMGRGPLLEAIKRTTGFEGDYDLASSSGFTDHQIVNQIIKPLKLYGANKESTIAKILESYCEIYRELLRSRKLSILNQADKILYELSQNEKILSLICTGNVTNGAKIKLENVNLNKYFKDQDLFCSENLEARSKIVARAKNLAIASGFEPIVVGDTVHDIEASRVNRIKCIALESEAYPCDSLVKASPFALLRLGWNLAQLESAIYDN